MRALVTGTSGAGKTTFAQRLARALALPHIELDAINWQPGWIGLNAADPDEFARRVDRAIAAESWVTDGNYGGVRQRIWARATDLIWLDYGREVIMPRVVRRSVRRAIDRRELWPGTGNREVWTRWFTDPEHPIRWAWDTWARRRQDYEARIADPANAHLQVHRLRHPSEAQPLIAKLTAESLLAPDA